MIRLVIFDIDGVLVSTRKLHEIAFIKSLKHFGILLTEKEHADRFDGLPTKTKIEMLGIDNELGGKISALKQELTSELADGHIRARLEVNEIFSDLRNAGIRIAVCSNAVTGFCELVMNRMGIEPDILLSNESVSKPKPDPEIYIKAMNHFEATPEETLIFEDSKFGILAATRSMANICVIQDPEFLTKKRVHEYLSIYKGKI